MSLLNTYQFRLNAPPTMNIHLMTLLTSLTGIFALDHRGRKFILVTPGKREKTELRITGPTGSQVHVSCPAISLTESFIIENTGLLVVDKFSYFKALTVHVTSSEDVSVHVFTGERSKEGYIVFPLAALSTEYILASFTFTQGETTQWLVVAVEDESDITVNYSNSHCKMNTFDTNINKNLNKFDNFSGTCTEDITGTFIRSTRPVAVFSRRLCPIESYDNVHCENHVIMLPPVIHFGKQYVLHVPDIPHVKVSYKVIAALNSTTITQNNGKIFRLCSGCFIIFEVLNPLYISSDKPLMVLTLSEIQKEMFHSSLSILVPVEGFMSSYTVHKEDGKTNMLVLSAGNDVIGSLVSKYDVTPVRIKGCDFSVVTVNLTEPTTTVSLLSPFGAFIYILDDLLFGFPVGFTFGPKSDVGESNGKLQSEASQTFQVDTNDHRIMSTTFDYLQSSSELSELLVVNVIDQRPWSSHSDDLPSTGTFQEETAQARKVLRRSKYVNNVLNSIKSSKIELDDPFESTMDMTNRKPTSIPSHIHSSISDTNKFIATKPDTLVTTSLSMSNDVWSRDTSAIPDSFVTTSTSVIGDNWSRDTKAGGLVSSSATVLCDVESNVVNTSPVKSITSTPNTIIGSTTGIFQAPSKNSRFRLRSGSILSKMFKNSNELQFPSATTMPTNTSKGSSTSLLDKGRNEMISATTSVASTICTRVCTPFRANITREYLLAAGRKIKETLLVDRKLLSAQVQKKTCSSDKRLSSTGIGIVGMICILVPVLLAVFSDTINILEKKKRVKSNESTLRRKAVYCLKENDVKDQRR